MNAELQSLLADPTTRWAIALALGAVIALRSLQRSRPRAGETRGRFLARLLVVRLGFYALLFHILLGFLVTTQHPA